MKNYVIAESRNLVSRDIIDKQIGLFEKFHSDYTMRIKKILGNN
ncbi:hypothetical protein [Aliarcobacter butzleri]|nr:hypothetical protein [Aliarcobacter butzleri]